MTIAWALVSNLARIIGETTGNLVSRFGEEIMAIFQQLDRKTCKG